MRRVLLALLLLGAFPVAAQEVVAPPGVPSTGGTCTNCTITGGTISNATIGGVTYGLNQTPFTIEGGGTGYVAGDYITLTCSGCTITTNPTIVIATVSGGAITATQVRQSGVFTKSTIGAIAFTQASTSGAGTGATFTGSLGPIASILNMPALGSGGGSGNGNLFLMGAEGPCSGMRADESTHFGDKAGYGLGIGTNDSNVIMGHNAAGNGIASCAAALSSGVIIGADALRDITGTNSSLIGIGTSALRRAAGASNNTAIGSLAGSFITTGSNNILLAPAPTLTTGNYNILLGISADVASASESHTFAVAGQFGNILKATGTDSPGATVFSIPGHLAMTGDNGVGTYSTDIQHGLNVSGILYSNGVTSLGCCLITQSGLGNVNHMNGPTDNDWNLVGGLAAQAVGAVTGYGINLVGSNARAGSGTVGAAAGGSLSFTGGNAARLTSGSAAGGGFTFTGGAGLANNNGGGFSFTGGGVTSTQGLGNGGGFTALTGTPSATTTNVGGPASGAVSIQSGIGGAHTFNDRTAGNSGTVVLGSLAGGGSSGSGGTGGDSGAVTISTGAGGAATGGSGTRNGGKSGTLTLQTGAAGAGATTNGTVGSIVLSPGGTAALTASSGQITTMSGPAQYTGAVKTTPATGATVTFAATQRAAIVVPAGTLATLTVTLPACAAANDGDERWVITSQIVTALTVGASAGSVVSPPTAATAGGRYMFHCYGADTTWY